MLEFLLRVIYPDGTVREFVVEGQDAAKKKGEAILDGQQGMFSITHMAKPPVTKEDLEKLCEAPEQKTPSRTVLEVILDRGSSAIMPCSDYAEAFTKGRAFLENENGMFTIRVTISGVEKTILTLIKT